MPLYLDIHSVENVTPEAVARAHSEDLDVQVRHGVEYTKYWLDEAKGKLFCLCRAPSVAAAARVHREAHGMEAERVIEVSPELVEQMLGGGRVNPDGAALMPGASSERDPGTRTILFTDIVGSTELTQRLGDEAAMDMLVIHDQIVRTALSATHGCEVKHTGDGIMASFVTASAAVECAQLIHDKLTRYRKRGKIPLRVRIGAAAGQPIERNNDLFGTTVQLAARLCAEADPDRTLVSRSVVERCPNLGAKSMGKALLKGFSEPLELYLVETAS